MPGRFETTTPGSPQGLNEDACQEGPGAVESLASAGHAISLLAVLVLACVLVLTPVVVAGISMTDPGALDETTSWFRRLAPIPSYLDHAKLAVAAGSIFMVWRGRQALNGQGAGT
jgi:hypothetical protein